MKIIKTKRYLFLILVFLLFGVLAAKLVLADEKVKEGRITEKIFSESRLPFGSLFLINRNETLTLKKDAEGFYEDNRVYTSKIYNTDFEFNGLGLKWQGEIPEGTEVNFEAKVFADDKWSPWITMFLTGEESKGGDPEYQYYTLPIFVHHGKKVQYRLKLSTNDSKISPKLDSVEFIYLDTEQNFKGKLISFLNNKISPKVEAASRLKIVSRADWGADEDWRLNSHDEEIWPAEYKKVKKFIIHHTAGSDGGDDPAATVRGIYYWHARVLAWGDIGYNYLIDREGNIYEGRSGGDGAIGGHTYNSLTDTNYNEGSMGIAVLGCFEEAVNDQGEPVCSNQNTLSKTVRNSLVNLLAQKAQNLQIKPKGKSEFFGEKTPNIIGHRDVDQTYCPGSNIENQLDKIRNAVSAKVNKLGGIKENYEAKISRYEILPATFVNDTQELTLVYRNAGTKTWSKEDTFLYIYDSGEKISRYRDPSWPDDFGKINFKEEEVGPDERATFVFKFLSPSSPGKFQNIFKLVVSGQEVKNSELKLETLVSSHFAAELVSHNIPKAVLNVWRPKVEIKFKNTGVATWSQEVILNIYDSGEKESKFKDNSWNSSSGEIKLKEKQVKPGEIGTFSFRLKTPTIPGLYTQIFKLAISGKDIYIDNGKFTLFTRVDPAKLNFLRVDKF